MRWTKISSLKYDDEICSRVQLRTGFEVRHGLSFQINSIVAASLVRNVKQSSTQQLEFQRVHGSFGANEVRCSRWTHTWWFDWS